MENKDSKFQWNPKNNSLVFGLCLAGAAVFSVLLASSQVKNAEKEKNQAEIQNEAALENTARSGEAAFVPQVDEAIRKALEQTESGLPVPETPEEMEEASMAAASDDIFANAQEEETEVAETEENVSTVEAASAEILPTVAFQEADSLSWPVAGSVTLDYSMDGSIYFPTLQQYKYNPALVIGSDVGAQVAAAAKGIVERIDNEAETGTTIVMNIGNGYKLKYGQMKDLAVAEGDVVERGALLGYIDEPTKYYCVEGSNLYFAMTKDEVPVDPVLYLE